MRHMLGVARSLRRTEEALGTMGRHVPVACMEEIRASVHVAVAATDAWIARSQ